MAGLSNADTDVTVSIDADLQDDISCIEKMIDKYHEGFEIVYGVRDNRTVIQSLKEPQQINSTR
jgi:glycosyltransferase involved in cell wall biosynthesis